MARPVTALLEEAAARLAAAGVENARLDAELLLRHVLGWDRARLVASSGQALEDGPASAFDGLVARRARRVPVQHLTGTAAFWRHEFLVTRDVLIPRPETEAIVELALARLHGTPRARIADVGTGSGCIALSLAAELPDAEVHATDVSPAALDVARQNARRLGLDGRVRFHEGDLLRPVAGLAFDLIASNPPYVDPASRASLQPEVRDHEPGVALFPPGETLSVYRRLAPEAAASLRAGSWLVVEVGAGQSQDVAGVLAASGLVVEQVAADLQGIPRTLVARRP